MSGDEGFLPIHTNRSHTPHTYTYHIHTTHAHTHTHTHKQDMELEHSKRQGGVSLSLESSVQI